MGEVLTEFEKGIPWSLSSSGGMSFVFGTEDFDEKNVLNKLLFSWGSLITVSPSVKGGV